MNTINTLSRSKYFVLSIAFALVTVLFAARTGHAQQLQQGVSVQLAATSNAAPMPEADNQDAWIVAITGNGNIYFGTDEVTPTGLVEAMKVRPRNREQKLYVKTDARAPFSDLEKVVEAARVDLFQAVVLLTEQPGAPEPGTVVPPKGLEVQIDPALPAGTVATVVELSYSGQQPLTLKINNDQISWSALQSTLTQHFLKGDERVILLKAGAHVRFADVVHAIDACRAAGARVVLSTPQL
jgi:biopolymer transport protein ExbD